MNIMGLDYADFSLVRELVSNHRYNRFREIVRLAKRRKIAQDVEQLNQIQRQWFSDMGRPDEIGACNRILKAMQDAEDGLKQEIENQKGVTVERQV